MRTLAVVLALLAASCAESHELDTDVDASSPPPPDRGGGTGSSHALVIDDGALHWVDPALDRVLRQEGGAALPELLVADVEVGERTVALSATHVFWVAHRDGVEVWRTPRRGGPAERAASPGLGPIGIAAEGDHLFVSVASPPSAALVDVTLATRETRTIRPDHPAIGIVAGDGELFTVRCDRPSVDRISLDGAVTTVASDSVCPLAIQIDDTHVYFVDSRAGERFAVFRAPRAGGETQQITTVDQTDFAVKDGFVYAVLDGAIIRVAVEGGDPSVLARAPGAAAVAVDETTVYWLELDASSAFVLRRAPLP